MSKKTIITLSICIALIAVAVVVYVVLRKKPPKEDVQPGITHISDKKPASGTASGVNTTILKRGSRGEEVKQLQQYLNAKILANMWSKGYPTYAGNIITEFDTDGIFGSKTEAVCQWYFGKPSVTINEIK